MPAQYDIKSIGDQVHKLTLELEVEKILTDVLFKYVHGTTGVDMNFLNRSAENIADSDEDSRLLVELLNARFSGIKKSLNL